MQVEDIDLESPQPRPNRFHAREAVSSHMLPFEQDVFLERSTEPVVRHRDAPDETAKEFISENEHGRQHNAGLSFSAQDQHGRTHAHLYADQKKQKVADSGFLKSLKRSANFLASWFIPAFIFAEHHVCPSLMLVVGLAFLKKGSERAHWGSCNKSRFKLSFAPFTLTWIIGFALLAFASVFSETEAHCIAPMTFLSPATGISLVMAQLSAHFFLDERVQLFPDVVGTAFVLVAGELISLDISDMGPTTHTLVHAVDAQTRVHFLMFSAVAVAVAIDFVEMILYADPSGNSFGILIKASGAAAAGVLVDAFVRTEMIHNDGVWTGRIYHLVCCVLLVFAQTLLLSRGLAWFDQKTFVPVYCIILALLLDSLAADISAPTGPTSFRRVFFMRPCRALAGAFALVGLVIFIIPWHTLRMWNQNNQWWASASTADF